VLYVLFNTLVLSSVEFIDIFLYLTLPFEDVKYKVGLIVVGSWFKFILEVWYLITSIKSSPVA